MERLAQIVHHQTLISLFGDCQGLVGVNCVELMVSPSGGMVFAISLIRAQPCVAEIIVFVSTSDKSSHAGDQHWNQIYTCFHVLFVFLIGCKNTNIIYFSMYLG